LPIFLQPIEILAALAIIFLPGVALLAWLRPRGQDPLEFLALSSGLSLALSAFFGELLFFTGWKVTQEMWVLIYLVCLLVIASGITFHLFRKFLGKSNQVDPGSHHLRSFILLLGGIIILGSLAYLRFFQASGLVVGPWVDSVAHTYTVQLMTASQGVPRYLLPFLPGISASYITFDISAWVFTTLTSLQTSTGVLWMSLLVSALVPLSLYRLGRVLWSDWKPAALAALLSGFAFTFPVFLLGWGRSSLLSLCVLFSLLAAEIIHQNQLPAHSGEAWKAFVVILILSAGTFLCDPFGLGLTILFLGAFYLSQLIPAVNQAKNGGVGIYPLAATAAGYIAVLPYLREIPANNLFSAGSTISDPALPLANLTFLIATPRDAILLALAIFGLVMLIIERRSRELVVLTLLLVTFSLPSLATSLFPQEELRVLLSLPAALLGGYFLADTAGMIARLSWPWIAYPILGIETAALVAWGVLGGVSLYPPVVILADATDIQALDWIRANTPADARILNQPAPWQPGVYRGVDGGYWIINLIGRGQLIPPPQYTSAGLGYQARINDWAKAALSLEGCSEDFWKLAADARLGYLYLKAGSGKWAAKDFESCPGFFTVYEKDGITIFELSSPDIIPEK
jgi:hypothetical protein